MYQIKKFIKYLELRFPFLLLLLFCLLSVLSMQQFLRSYIDTNGVLLGICYTLLLLHIRLLDEFKDFEFDSVHFNDRPVQSGLVTLNDIRIYAIINLSLMFLITLVLKDFLLVFILTLLYTALMYKEFFIKDFAEHLLPYLITHEFMFFIFFTYVLSIIKEAPTYFWIDSANFLLLVYLFIPVLLVEIGRKMKHRFNSMGEITADTYAYLWGEKNSLLIFLLIALFNILVLFELTNTIYILPLVLLTVALYILSFTSIRQLLTKYSMLITISYTLAFPLVLLIVI